jgi:hypothetical protein
MIKSLSSPEETERQAKSNNQLTNQKLHIENGCDHTAGPLSIEIPFPENVSKPVSPAEDECDVSWQVSPYSDVSFGWEEITVNAHLTSKHSSYEIESGNSPVSECLNSDDERKGTSDDRDSLSSTEHSIGRDVSCLDETVASKRESELAKDVYSMKNTHNMSESEDSESGSTCHSRRESAHSQNLVLEPASPVKLADSSFIKKKADEVSRKEEYGSDPAYDEVTQTNRMKTYS